MNTKWKENLKKYLLDEKGAPPADIVYFEKSKYIPPKIYKYRIFGKESIMNLVTNTAYLRSPKEFKDPNDSLILFSMKGMMDSICKYFGNDHEIFKSIEQYFTDKEIGLASTSVDFYAKIIEIGVNKFHNGEEFVLREIQTVTNRLFKDYSQEMVNSFNEQVLDSLKIGCFSENKDSPPMWEHYCDNYQGFVIEYDFTETTHHDYPNRFLYPVFYVDKLPDLSEKFIPSKTSPFIAEYASLHKFSSWKYEKEWRLIISGGIFKDNLNYLMPKISSIYLGQNINKANREELIQIAKKMNIQIFLQKHIKSIAGFEYDLIG